VGGSIVAKVKLLSAGEVHEMLCRREGIEPYPHGKNADGSPVILEEELIEVTDRLQKALWWLKGG
jgi:hypothetical protein